MSISGELEGPHYLETVDGIPGDKLTVIIIQEEICMEGIGDNLVEPVPGIIERLVSKDREEL